MTSEEIEFLDKINKWAATGLAPKREQYEFVQCWRQQSIGITSNEDLWCDALGTLTNKLMGNNDHFQNLNKVLVDLKSTHPSILKKAPSFFDLLECYKQLCSKFGSVEFNAEDSTASEAIYSVLKIIKDVVENNGSIVINHSFEDIKISAKNKLGERFENISISKKVNQNLSDFLTGFKKNEVVEKLSQVNDEDLNHLLEHCKGIRIPSLRYYRNTLSLRKRNLSSNFVTLDDNVEGNTNDANLNLYESSESEGTDYDKEKDDEKTGDNELWDCATDHETKVEELKESLFSHIIDALDEETIEVFFLYFQGKKIENSTLEKTAKQCNLTINQVRKRVHRCYEAVFQSLLNAPCMELTHLLLSSPVQLAIIVDGTVLPYRDHEEKLLIVATDVLQIAENKPKFIFFLDPKTMIKLICVAGSEFGEQFCLVFLNVKNIINDPDSKKIKASIIMRLENKIQKNDVDSIITGNLMHLCNLAKSEKV